MWSLFENRKKEEDKSDKSIELKPKVFSNEKTQEDVVNEVVNEIKKGTKVIFINGKCGTGKSAIALNIAKELGRASIVVPIKNLQRQYENDYLNKKFLLKNNGEKLKIEMITGRKNHICPYLLDNKEEIKKSGVEREEKNASLFDIFKNLKDMKKKKSETDCSCDNLFIPCKIEIKEKNIKLLGKYYQENPEKKRNFKMDIRLLKRFAVAPACPYWCPIINAEKDVDINAEPILYKSISGNHVFYLRKEGCPYYKQFLSYINSDAIIFNSDLYLLETALGRKPATNIEIIDECDEFLDNLSVEGSINLNRLRNELVLFDTDDSEERRIINSVIDDLDVLLFEAKKNSESEDILELKNTRAKEIIKAFVNNEFFYENIDDESYIAHCFEVSCDFYDVMNESHASFLKDKKNDLYIKLVTINLDKLLKNLIDKNKAFIFMSGTLHSERVLKEVFGLDNFKVIDAETFNPGTITKLKTGLEKDFKFDNFEKNKVTREEYLKALDKCVEISEKPAVVQVSAFQDLPAINEIQNFNLKNLISEEELIEQQKNDKEGRLVKDFKDGKTKILFTTRCSRGIDFPFSVCNSVVITKFPYPNVQSLFWKILKKNKPCIFWDFYKDKAYRELLQRVYRSVRAPEDHVFLLSPDIRVLESKII